VEVADMKTDENYLVKSLKTSESKSQITEEQYLKFQSELMPTGKSSE
jgi:hypothetical protein